MEKSEKRTECGALAPVRGLLRGAGQVMFQPSGWTGLLFLAGIFWSAWSSGRMAVAWGAVAGLAAATLTGRCLCLNREERKGEKEGMEGLWGFNGILVGCALMTFLKSTPLTWAVLFFGAAASVWVRTGLNRVMAPWRINSLTMPFVLTTWLLLSAARALNGVPAAELPQPELPAALLSSSPSVDTDFLPLAVCWLNGLSQVFLCNSWVAGLLFLIGLALCNGWSALWSAVASALSLALALLFGGEGSSVAAGLYGFSPVLTGIALGSIFYRPSWRSALWTVAGIVFTFFTQAALNVWLAPVGLPALTAPFCIATWLFLLPMLPLDKDPETDHSAWSAAHKPHLG